TLQWVPIICLFCLAIVLMYPELLLWVLGALLLFFLFRTNKFLYGLTMPVYALVSLATWNYGFLKGLSRKVMPTHLQDERPNR
ncbi:MAG: hypothetical protein KDK51_09145, partial [Deltaproteobacteria bacterium]|nr:hypothetical protein [Deltaproteobacteria bacterium]